MTCSLKIIMYRILLTFLVSFQVKSSLSLSPYDLWQIHRRYPCRWGGVVDGKPIVSNLDSFGNRVMNNIWTAIKNNYLKQVCGPLLCILCSIDYLRLHYYFTWFLWLGFYSSFISLRLRALTSLVIHHTKHLRKEQLRILLVESRL